MKRTFKFRLYPTSAQAAALDWTLARCCELYNAALQERKEAWNACKRHPNFYDPEWRAEHAGEYSVHYYDQANALPDLKRAPTRVRDHRLPCLAGGLAPGEEDV